MDIKEIEFIFRYMTPQQRQKLLSKVKAFNLATNINKDREFLEEALDEIANEYPFIKEYIVSRTKTKRGTDHIL